MSEQVPDAFLEHEQEAAVETPASSDLDRSGRDRSADYTVDQAQAHRNADEGREMPYTTADPV